MSSAIGPSGEQIYWEPLGVVPCAWRSVHPAAPLVPAHMSVSLWPEAARLPSRAFTNQSQQLPVPPGPPLDSSYGHHCSVSGSHRKKRKKNPIKKRKERQGFPPRFGSPRVHERDAFLDRVPAPVCVPFRGVKIPKTHSGSVGWIPCPGLRGEIPLSSC